MYAYCFLNETRLVKLYCPLNSKEFHEFALN